MLVVLLFFFPSVASRCFEDEGDWVLCNQPVRSSVLLLLEEDCWRSCCRRLEDDWAAWLGPFQKLEDSLGTL